MLFNGIGQYNMFDNIFEEAESKYTFQNFIIQIIFMIGICIQAKRIDRNTENNINEKNIVPI